MTGLVVAVIAAVAGIVLLGTNPARTRLRRMMRTRGGAVVGAGDPGRSASAEALGSLPSRWEGGGVADAAAAHPLPAHLTGPDDPARAITVIDRAAELLRVGLPPAEALARLAELSDQEIATVLTRAARSLSLGDDPRTAITRHAGALPGPVAEVLTGMGSVWYVAETAGAPAADMLERFAASRREVADAERERAVSLAGPKATVTVLTWLPAAGLGLALLIGADPLALLTSGLGIASLLSGAVLLACGRLWMTSMLRRAR